MAKGNNKEKSFADVLRTSAYVWLGNTNMDDTYVLLTIFNDVTHWVIVDTKDNDLMLKAPAKTVALKKEIFTALYEINPAWKGRYEGDLKKPDLPKGLAITSDWNQTFYDKGIKPLKETTVVPFLDALGINITMYEYTKLSVDNSHGLVVQPIVRGYENYSPEVLKYMVDTSKYKGYTLTKKNVYYMLDKGCYRGIIAAGPPATGKTTDAFAWANQIQVPVIDYQCVHNTEADDIIGKYVPKADGSGFEFLYGPLALAVKYDCIFTGQEWNYAPSSVQSIVNSLMDGNGRITLPNGEVLTVGPNFRMILTVNPGYRGTNMFNAATVNRFIVSYYKPLNKKQIIERLEFESDYHNMKVLEAIAEQFNKIHDIYVSKNFELDATYRNASEFLVMSLKTPEIPIDEQFHLAFVEFMHLELDDPAVADLTAIGKELLKDIKAAIAECTGEVVEASWSCIPEEDPEDINSIIGDDGSFLGVKEEE